MFVTFHGFVSAIFLVNTFSAIHKKIKFTGKGKMSFKSMGVL